MGNWFETFNIVSSAFPDFPLIKVRRKMYKPCTTAGKGIKWEWLSGTTCEWNMYNMDVQNIIEDAWSKVCRLL